MCIELSWQIRPRQYYPPFVLVFLLAWLSPAIAQSIDNVKASVQNDLIVVEYDLKPGNNASDFTIKLYASHNNFQQPLRLVSGDVGEKVESGSKKSITWSAKSELINYKGDLSFEVRAEPITIIHPFTFTSPSKGSSVKRTRRLGITWRGGVENEDIQLLLTKNNVVKYKLSELKNSGSYDWMVPKHVKKGTYQLSLTGPSGQAESMSFRVKPKTSAFVKILPALIIGAVVVITSVGEKPPGPDNKLPIPPDPD